MTQLPANGSVQSNSPSSCAPEHALELQTFAVHSLPCIYCDKIAQYKTTNTEYTLNGDATHKCATNAINTAKIKIARILKPTLSQTWPQGNLRPQYAFKMSMFKVSCNSH
jgi:hypothetical protein